MLSKRAADALKRTRGGAVYVDVVVGGDGGKPAPYPSYKDDFPILDDPALIELEKTNRAEAARRMSPKVSLLPDDAKRALKACRTSKLALVQ